MEGTLAMSGKERRRLVELEEVRKGHGTLQAAAERLGISYRQLKRSWTRYEAEGAAGLVHRGRGRPSNRRSPEGFRAAVVGRYVERYQAHDVGPTLAAEKLAEEGYRVSPKTLWRWLRAEGHWARHRRGPRHRRQRTRKAHFGELVQMDGSPHAWLGPDQPPVCLLAMIDDATNTRLALLAPAETTEGYLQLLTLWIERYGIPRALYTDRKNIFVTDRAPTREEALAGEAPRTPFGRACQKLGIAIIPASSPQAKGRIERSHGVYQDRFVKELALQGITDMDSANRILLNGFTTDLNRRFTVPPVLPDDFHRPVPPGLALEDVLCFEEARTVQRDWTIRYENRCYQIEADNRPLPRPQDTVQVRVRLDGSLHLVYRERPLHYTEVPPAPVHPERASGEEDPGEDVDERPDRSRPTPKPAWNHPWRPHGLRAAARPRRVRRSP